MVKIVICGGLGTLPGIILVACGFQSLGVALIVLGGLIGILLGVPGVSLDRIGLFFAILMLNRYVPLIDLDEAKHWQENHAPISQEPSDFNNRLVAWLRAEDILHRRTSWVIAGLVVGLLGGVALAVRDIAAIWANQPGWVLVRGVDDGGVVVNGVVMAVASAGWGGALAAILGAPAYARSVILGTTFAGFCGFASGLGLDGASWGLAFIASTLATFVGLSFGFLVTHEINESKRQGMNPSDMPNDNGDTPL